MNTKRVLLLSCVAVAMLFTNAPAQAHHDQCCEPAPVCCPPPPPPPVLVKWCVVDPCDPCAKYQVSACLPACCACEIPCLAGWKKGFLGRKVLTYKFPGCGECVEVVIKRHGGAFVR